MSNQQHKYQEIEKDFEDNKSEDINLEECEENKKLTRIENKVYDQDTLNRIIIIRFTQLEIRKK